MTCIANVESKWSVENVISRRKQCRLWLSGSQAYWILSLKKYRIFRKSFVSWFKISILHHPHYVQEPQSCGLLIRAVATVKNIISQNPPAGKWLQLNIYNLLTFNNFEFIITKIIGLTVIYSLSKICFWRFKWTFTIRTMVIGKWQTLFYITTR
jgi:hypothetical protein